MRFRTTILLSGRTATGIRIPPEVVTELGAGRRPPVRVTINGHTYRSTVATMGGAFMVGISAENRAGAGVGAGDEVDVDIQLDTEPRQVTLPADFSEALERDAGSRRFFEGLSHSQQRWFVSGIEGAKKADTRARRIVEAVSRLREGRAQR